MDLTPNDMRARRLALMQADGLTRLLYGPVRGGILLILMQGLFLLPEDREHLHAHLLRDMT